MERHHAELLALGADHPNFTGANLMIDPRFSGYGAPPFAV
jgi:hypothetical protein